MFWSIRPAAGAAWSFFHDRNEVLKWVSAAALLGLMFWRRHFHIENLLGQISLGLICGGIAGNLVDRIVRHQVVDFLRFYLLSRGGVEIGFPAFNVADSAICVGVGLLILVSRLETAGWTIWEVLLSKDLMTNAVLSVL